MNSQGIDRVIFRHWRKRGLGDDIIAVFPDNPVDFQGHVGCYEHIGQHGAADYYHILRQTTPARPEEYLSLKTELERIGYKLKVVKRR